MENITINSFEDKVIEISSFDELNLTLLSDSKLTLKVLNLNNETNGKLSAKVHSNAKLDVIYADFGSGSVKVQSVVDLVEEGATCDWKLAALSNKKDIKEFDISFNHFAPHTTALMDNYGVARDESTLLFKGINHIHENCPQSETRQNAKIIVFDPKANGKASPALRIDENDVKASHGAVVGQLSSDHMFYLMSRGLTKNEARELITLGYLRPISNHFSDDKKELIAKAISEAL